jgi:hypothetical protein
MSLLLEPGGLELLNLGLSGRIILILELPDELGRRNFYRKISFLSAVGLELLNFGLLGRHLIH